MRIACAVEYDGSAFCGWQRQNHARSVQGDVEAALSKVADHEVRVVCAGRTDSGVHASWQIIHFDTSATRSERSWVLGTNANLPDDAGLLWDFELPFLPSFPPCITLSLSFPPTFMPSPFLPPSFPSSFPLPYLTSCPL